MELLVRGAARLGLNLSSEQVEQFQLYLRELLEWNQRINLTAIIEPREVELLHFLDSLTLYEVIQASVTQGSDLLDVGTGAGFPGLPLKIALPRLSVTLMESTGKKVRFLENLVGVLGLNDARICHGRAEQLAHRGDLRSAFDVVTSRAVAPLNVLAEITLPFCRHGGLVVVPKKGQIDEEVKDAERALDTLGGSLVEARHVRVEGLGDDRFLLVIKKVRDTPDRYPRRPGIPHKRPL